MNRSLTDIISIETLDQDGALRETAAAVEGDTRAGLFRKAGIAGGSLLASGVVMGGLPALASAAPSKRQDIAILNYALTLEYLEAAFYKEAVQKGRFPGRTGEFARIVAGHEATHVKTLKSVLGSKAVASPKFNFKDTTTVITKFRNTSFVLENTGVEAYSGQATNIASKAYIMAAVSILTVEARHASAIAVLIGGRLSGSRGFTPNGAFDKAADMKAILKGVKATGFITG